MSTLTEQVKALEAQIRILNIDLKQATKKDDIEFITEQLTLLSDSKESLKKYREFIKALQVEP